MKTNKPSIGMIIKVHGQDCRIFKIHAFGTVDCESLSTGKCYRVTGLMF